MPALLFLSVFILFSLQAENLNTSVVTQSDLKSTHEAYEYKPTDKVFWTRIQNWIERENYPRIVSEATRQELNFGLETIEGAEARLAAALGLKKMGLYHGAFYLLSELARTRMGSAVSEAALYYLGLITQQSIYDHDALEQMLIQHEFSDLHPEVMSFVSYYRTIYNLKYGFHSWAEVDEKRILTNSYWDHLLQYWTAIGEVARDRKAEAKEILSQLNEKELPSRLGSQVRWQLSRIYFEEGDFSRALELQGQVFWMSWRDHGRLLLEKAWTQYYLKNYSQALGILAGLESPYFSLSLSYEKYILEALIYRELCHYDHVEKVASRFRQRFSIAFMDIRERKELRKNRQLFNLAVLPADVQQRAELIDRLRKEKKQLQSLKFNKSGFVDRLLYEYEHRDTFLQTKINWELEKRVREVANRLLDAEEQMLFIEYTSRLDALRFYRDQGLDYSAPPISYIRFERIFWPVDNEFWLDEIDSYTMLISSRCGLPPQKLEVLPIEEAFE